MTRVTKKRIEALQHYVDTTIGLWCIDRNPKDVTKEWIEENAFRLTAPFTDKQADEPSFRVSPNVQTKRRIKQVTPPKNRCSRLFRTLRILLFREPLWDSSDDTLCRLFWSLRRANAFFAEDSINQSIKRLKRQGYSVREEMLPMRKANELRHCQSFLLQGRPVCRIIRKLSLQGSEATMSVRLVLHRPSPDPLSLIFQVAENHHCLSPYELHFLLSNH